MFGKIKGKLGDIFKKNEEHIEENADEVVQEESTKTQEITEISEESETKEEKKSFLGGIFSKKKEEEESLEDLDEIKEEESLTDNVQDAVLDGVEEKEKEEIKSGEELGEDEIKKHKEEVELAIEKEEELEKETNEDISKADEHEVEHALEDFKTQIDNSNSQSRIETPVTSIDEKQEEKVVENLKESELEEQPEEKKGFFSKVFKGSKKEEELPAIEEVRTQDVQESEDIQESSEGFFSKAMNVVKKKKITEEDYDKIWLDLEIFLLEINVAYEIVETIGRKLKFALIGNAFDRFGLSQKVREVMVSEVEAVLKTREGSFLDEVKKHKERNEPLRIMVLGVNGTGKTTSIGKVIKYLQNNDLSVVVAAADTFRAAAVDQIAKHCDNLGVKCIQHQHGGDPAAVAFDAVEHAKAKQIDVVLIDTAGRMPNNSNLMLELQKIKRVSNSQMALFIGDSISGNDLIDQISLFDKGVEINGVALTKVDTDERPGSVVTTAYSIEKPIYFLGIGQGYDDLVEFNAREVAEKLFDVEEKEE